MNTADHARARMDRANEPMDSRSAADRDAADLGEGPPKPVSTSGRLPPAEKPVWSIVTQSRSPGNIGGGTTSAASRAATRRVGVITAVAIAFGLAAAGWVAALVRLRRRSRS